MHNVVQEMGRTGDTSRGGPLFHFLCNIQCPHLVETHWGPLTSQSSSGKKNKFGHFLVVLQLIHRLTQEDISCTISFVIDCKHLIMIQFNYRPQSTKSI